MKEYLTIGDVSKLKGVSVKSLRYYADLGILVPAYINKETGYRYYKPHQLIIVDLICFCIGLDIPLKNFHSYIKENNVIDVENIIADGKVITQQKIAELTRNLCNIESASKYLTVNQEINNHIKQYSHNYNERFFLVKPWNHNCTDMSNFITQITNLYQKSKSYNLKITYNHGILRHFHKKGNESFIFLEVNKPDVLTSDFMIIPKGIYACEFFLNENIFKAEEKYFKSNQFSNGSLVITREVYHAKIESYTTPFEVQVFTLQ